MLPSWYTVHTSSSSRHFRIKGSCCSHGVKQQVSHLLKEWLYALWVTLLFCIIDALEKIVRIMLMYCPLIVTGTSLQRCTSARCTTSHSTATPLRTSACSVITCDCFWLLKHCSFFPRVVQQVWYNDNDIMIPPVFQWFQSFGTEIFRTCFRNTGQTVCSRWSFLFQVKTIAIPSFH